MKRWLPFPLLWVSLTALWLVLNQTLWFGHMLLGTLLAFGACLVYARLESPPQARTTGARRWRRAAVAARLLADVTVDIVRSNVAVARIVLDPGTRNRTTGFLDIPLELRDASALAALACIITATPGTAWARFDADRAVLTLHILDLRDEAGWVRLIKGRYERRLREIFE
jgi:multicomponent K+:H+ antiporter subunit E